jgi:hypothetical protein
MAFSFIIHQAEWRTTVVFMGLFSHLHFIVGQFMWQIAAVKNFRQTKSGGLKVSSDKTNF